MREKLVVDSTLSKSILVYNHLMNLLSPTAFEASIPKVCAFHTAGYFPPLYYVPGGMYQGYPEPETALTITVLDCFAKNLCLHWTYG